MAEIKLNITLFPQDFARGVRQGETVSMKAKRNVLGPKTQEQTEKEQVDRFESQRKHPEKVRQSKAGYSRSQVRRAKQVSNGH